MKVGDQVKLTDRTAECFDMARRWVRPRRISWRDRRGTVVVIAKRSDQVGVRWPDRKSIDFWPHAALEVLAESEMGRLSGR